MILGHNIFQFFRNIQLPIIRSFQLNPINYIDFIFEFFCFQYSLRQLDLSLLSQLWSLNESIQDFRQILQDQEDYRVLSPPSPSPAPSSGDEGDCDEQYYVNAPSATPSTKFRPAPPPPPVRRSSNSSNASTGG